MRRFILPLAVFIALVGFLAVGLKLNPREVPSPLVGKPAPDFLVHDKKGVIGLDEHGVPQHLSQLHDPAKTIAKSDLAGQVWLLNVWASWCVSCREEHPVLMDFAKQGVVPIIGLNYKDVRQDGMAWLSQFGNPYKLSAFDVTGGVGIDYGVYGVPETFVIDKRGVIRMKHIGAVTPEVIRDKLLPLIKELNRA
jgi:cytochrome c biogenesis protein CcmG/thiol:disulfide interchange protein DsbE